MPDIAELIRQGAASPWLYLPVAVLLGALHALEPGHSKSMMAAFIVATRGTPGDATLLGVSAAIGHTIVVWAIALLGLYLGDRYIAEGAEPWLMLVSGLLLVALAARLLWIMGAPRHHDHHRHHDHGHGYGHDHHDHGHHHQHDAHAAAHARELAGRFEPGQRVSKLDVAWLGFTGGLLPCPAAIAVLLVCLQLREFSLGVGMVAAFSVGLAVTLVAVGLAAVWGAEAARSRWQGFDRWTHVLPRLSAVLVLAVGLAMTAGGLWQIGLLRAR